MAEDAFPISGSIDPKAFPFLLMELHRQGATGSLKVDGPTYQKALYFRAGRVLFGSSNDPKDQLGSILIESGRITPEQLEDVNVKVGPGNPLAKVLAESGFVSQRELSEAARAKVERILSDVLSYDSGSFDFEDGVLPKGAVDLKLATDKLVLASVRRVADRGFVLRHIEGLDAVLALTADTASRLAEIHAETGRLPEYFDGRRSLKEAAAAARLDEFEAGKVACGLLFLGLVQRAKAAPAESGFAIVEDDGGMDLSQTARMAFVDEVAGSQSSAGAADTELPLDPAVFAPPSPPRPRATEPDTIFIEPTAPAASRPEPPLPLVPPRSTPPRAARRTPSDTNPDASPASEIRLPSLGDTGFEAAGAETLPKGKPPSREDLQALDALLNSRGIEGPLTPLEKPRDAHWEPRVGQKVAPSRGGRRSRGGSRRVLAIAAAFLAVGGLAIAAWLQFFQGSPPVPRVATSRPSPVVAPTTTTVATTLPPAAGPTPSPEASTPGIAPVTPTPPVPPANASTPPKVAAASPSPATSPRAAGGGTLGDARGALHNGDFSQAARGFAASLRTSGKGSYSVQLLVACSEETVQKATQNVPAQELFILPVDYKGRSCYRVCWGVYDSEAQARSAVHEIPDYFRKGGASPKPVATTTILP